MTTTTDRQPTKVNSSAPHTGRVLELLVVLRRFWATTLIVLVGFAVTTTTVAVAAGTGAAMDVMVMLVLLGSVVVAGDAVATLIRRTGR